MDYLVVLLFQSVFLTIAWCRTPGIHGYTILKNFYGVPSGISSEETNSIWCRIAHSNTDATPTIAVVEPPHGKVQIPLTGRTTPSSEADTLTSVNLGHAREWMEYVAFVQNDTFGAYTVIRCETVAVGNTTTTMPTGWKVWGLPFHYQRLKQSYSTLVSGNVTKEQLLAACNRTDLIMERLLFEANTAMTTTTAFTATTTTTNCSRIILMLTILWTPRRRNSMQLLGSSSSTPTIDVYGHARHVIIPNNPSSPPPPMVAMLAIEPSTCGTTTRTNPCERLPCRYDRIPYAKLSSWCYNRKILEKKFKRILHDGGKRVVIGEVFLTRRRSTTRTQQLWSNNATTISSNSNISSCSIPQDVELLEGLTTNIFVLYQDGTLRTASNGVLHGYIRQLVLQQKTIKISLHPPLLSEVHQWKEVFVSSSIQLLCPIHAIYAYNSSTCYTNSTTITDTTNNTLFTKLWEYHSSPQEHRLVDVIFNKLINSPTFL